MTVVGMDTREGFAPSHLYQPASEDLVLAAYRGVIDRRDRAKVQSVVRGEGITSALHPGKQMPPVVLRQSIS